MSTLTESDVRRIVREELESQDATRRAERAAQPSIVDQIAQIKREVNEKILMRQLAEILADGVDGLPESVDVGFDVGGVNGGVRESHPRLDADAATNVVDGVDNVVGHESSPSGSGSAAGTADAPRETVGEPSAVALPPELAAPGGAIRESDGSNAKEHPPGL